MSGTGELMVEGDVEKPEEFCRVMEEANLPLLYFRTAMERSGRGEGGNTYRSVFGIR